MSEVAPVEIATAEGRLVLADSITQVRPAHEGAVFVTGSHGGRSSAGYAKEVRALVYAFNDAGIGRDAAGIAALDILEGVGIAAITVDAATARIGEAANTFERGIVSHVNSAAAALGYRTGLALRELVKRHIGRFPS